jgi:hypothetical protein
MAEVYGSIGDQPVELQNAATEATLAALLEVARLQFNTVNKPGSKRAKELEANLKKLADEALNSSKAFKTSTNQRRIDQLQERKQIQERNVESGKVTTGLANLAVNISKMGDSISSATQVFTSLLKSVPIVGEALGGFAGAVASSIENTQKSFMASAAVGATFNASISTMIRSASEAGLTIDQFTGIIAKNGESLSLLADTTQESAKRFASLGKSIKNSDISDQLANLGMNTTEINEGMLTFIGLLAKGGTDIKNMIPEDLIALTGNYYRNLSAVSQLTGESRKTLEAEVIARQRDSKARIMESRLDETSRNNYRTMLLSVSKEHRGAAEEIMLNMGIQSDSAKAFAALAPEAAQAFLNVGQSIQQTGKLSENTTKNIYDVYAKQARDFNSNTAFRDILGGPLQSMYGEFSVGMMDVASRGNKNLDEAFASVTKTMAERGTELGEMDPRELLKVQQSIAQSSNDMTRTLLRFSGPLLAALEGFSELTLGAVLVIDELSTSVGRIIIKFKEFYKIFQENSVGSLFGKLVTSITDGVSAGVDYLIEKSVEIGQQIGTGLMKYITDFKINEWLIGKSAKDISDTSWVTAKYDKRGSNNRQFTPTAVPQAIPSAIPVNTPAQKKENEAKKIELDRIEEMAKLDKEDKDRRERLQAKLTAKVVVAQTSNTESVKENTKETAKSTSETQRSTNLGLDYSSPQALFNSFAKVMIGGSTGATSTSSMTGTSANSAASGSNEINYKSDQGSFKKVGGHRNWRANNPGNIEYGAFAQQHGAIGTDGRFAVFPTMEMGYKAADALMKSKNYQDLSIGQAMSRWAPPSENDTGAYQKQFANAGFDLSKKYKDLSLEEQKKYLETKMRVEGGKEGQVFGNQQIKATASTAGGGTTPTAQQASTLMTADAAVVGGGTTPTAAAIGAPNAQSSTSITGLQDQMQTLNTSVDRLIAVNEESRDALRRLGSVMRNSSSDAYSV